MRNAEGYALKGMCFVSRNGKWIDKFVINCFQYRSVACLSLDKFSL